MPTKKHYSEYTSDENLIRSYNAYQNKYRATPRHSDVKTLQLVENLASGREDFTLLDVGCSTGNFLYHARKRFQKAAFTGCDLAQSSIRNCKNDPDLANISFSIGDVTALPYREKWDFITANAVTVYFDKETFEKALRSVAAALKPGGAYVAFEWIHSFAVQDIKVCETSEWNPDGLTFYFRPASVVANVLKKVGFDSVSFHPFVLPEDLPHPGFDADVMTYTKKDEFGERMAFRGALYQPWCHLVARKA
jgi:SAM-dependent methyltransferase